VRLLLRGLAALAALLRGRRGIKGATSLDEGHGSVIERHLVAAERVAEESRGHVDSGGGHAADGDGLADDLGRGNRGGGRRRGGRGEGREVRRRHAAAGSELSGDCSARSVRELDRRHAGSRGKTGAGTGVHRSGTDLANRTPKHGSTGVGESSTGGARREKAPKAKP